MPQNRNYTKECKNYQGKPSQIETFIMNLDQMMPIIVAAVGSAGLWGFLSLRAKQAHEKAIKDDAKAAELNDTLRDQVERLAQKLDLVIADKENLLREMSDMKASLAEANATIKHLEELLRAR